MLAAPDRRATHLAAMREQALEEPRRLVRQRPVAGCGDEQRVRLLRLELELPRRRVDRQPRRTRIEMQPRGARDVIEAAIVEQHVGRPEQPARADAAALAPLAANFKQIGEVIVEQQCQSEAGAAVAMILHADALIGGAAPQEDRAHDVQQILLQVEASVTVNVGVGEIDRQGGIVVAQIGAEQQRLEIVEHELEPREVARIVVEQAIGTAGGRADVAVAVEHDEGVVVLERAPRPCRGPGHRDIERLLSDLFPVRVTETNLDTTSAAIGCSPAACVSKRHQRKRRCWIYAANFASRLISCVTSSR